MEIPYYDNPGGTLTATVHLQHQSDAFLVDEQNYRNYRSGKPFTYFGGHFVKTPATITVNGAGRWYLIVNNGSGESFRYNWS